MANAGSVATPNEAYIFFKKRFCKLCGSELNADDRTIRFDQEYICTAECSLTPHYFAVVNWKCPTNIMLESETFEFDFEDKTYRLDLSCLSEHSMSYIDGVEIPIKSSRLHCMKLSEESIARRINTVRLLK